MASRVDSGLGPVPPSGVTIQGSPARTGALGTTLFSPQKQEPIPPRMVPLCSSSLSLPCVCLLFPTECDTGTTEVGVWPGMVCWALPRPVPCDGDGALVWIHNTPIQFNSISINGQWKQPGYYQHFQIIKDISGDTEFKEMSKSNQELLFHLAYHNLMAGHLGHKKTLN